MHDGTCSCGTCHCPGYSEALDYADAGLVSMLHVKRDEGYPYLALSAYQPHSRELPAFVYADENIRAMAHVALMVYTADS
jgi:hypothetical protein